MILFVNQLMKGGHMIFKTAYEETESHTAKVGSKTRHLFQPSAKIKAKQSLSEATIPLGSESLIHKHKKSEEIIHITEGVGLMTVEKNQFDIAFGDTICIPPGTPHGIKNTGGIPLKLLCCFAPPYSPNDVELL